MKISQTGLDGIKKHEGLRLNAYPDPASGGDPWTIGYGHTRDVERGQTITHAQAEQFLREDLAWVETCIERSVKVPLTQGQYDALASLIFNIGAGAFTTSTLLKMLNAGDYAGAAQQFARWNIAAGRVNLGLTNRRAAEQALFLSDSPPAAAPSPGPPAREAWQSSDPAQYSQEGGIMPIPAIVTALLPAVVAQIPALTKLFKPGSAVAERNVALAGAVLDVVTTATGAVNAQAAVEAIQKDPAALAAASKAVESEWFALEQAAESSRDAARKFSVEYAARHDVRTVVWNLTFLEVLSLLLVLSTLAGGMAVLIWGGIDAQLKGAVVTLMLIGGFTGVTQFWFGSSLGSKKKDDERVV